MPDSGWQTATGESSYVLNGGTPVPVNAVLLWVDSFTETKVRVLSTLFPRNLQYAGSIRLLTHDTGPDGEDVYAVAWQIHINYEYQEWFNYAPVEGLPNTHHIDWKLPGGLTLKFRAFW